MAHQMMAANGISLCAEAFGDKAAPPIVLIMGLGAQMIVWDTAFCTALADRGFHVLRFDNRDIGLSTRFPEAGVPNAMALMGDIALRRQITVPYTLVDMAKDTAGLMDAFGLKSAHVVGASMGGMIGQEMAINMTERLRSFVSIFSSTGDPRLPQATPEAAAMLFTPVPTERAAYIAHSISTQRIIRGPHFPEENALDEARAAGFFDRGLNPAGVARQFAAILASGNRTEKLSRVKTPTLVIHGDADPLVRVEAGRATAKAIPGAKLEIIANMGHSLPKALWPRLIDLIAGHCKAH